MKSTAFIVTYERDLPWFKWCLASIGRFWAEDSQILVNVDPSLISTIQDIAKEVAPNLNVETEAFVQWGNNRAYAFQQWAKLTIYQRTTSDVIVYFDSDLIVNRTIGISDFMDIEKKRLRWFYEPYSSVSSTEPGAQKWLTATWRAFNIRPEYEFMRRHLFLVWRETLEGCVKYLEGQHGPLADYLLNLPGDGTDVEFSEFNCLGFYAWLFNADKYWFLDVTQHQKEAGPKYWTPGTALDVNPVDQHHSWTGDPEQAHGRFLQACEAADFHIGNAKKEHADICLGMERTGPFAADQKPVTIIEDPFEQDLSKAGFVKSSDGETYEKLPTDSVPAGESL